MNVRVWLMLGLIYAVFVVFGVRLWQLQVVQYQQFATRSQGNYLRTESTLAPRGRILDRNGVVLASNRLAVDLVYRGGDVLFKERILAVTGLRAFPEVGREPVKLMENVPEQLVPTLGELTAGEPNLRLVERVERVYPNPISGPVIGYTGLPSQEQVVGQDYEPEELIGASGLEAALENQLRGRKGLQLVEVNARGQRIRIDEQRPPVAGPDVRLTIDLKLQRAAEQALKEGLADVNRLRVKNRQPLETVARGAIVALDPRTGEVLAMATNPGFDPNLFGRRPRPSEQLAALFRDKNRPTLNRAISAFPPGSTYKLSSSSMFLEQGYVTTGTAYRCSSAIPFGGRLFRNWFRGDMGMFTVEEAIAQSCNTWYYQVAKTDPFGIPDKLHSRSLQLGLGRATGLEISESEGLIPTIAWKRQAVRRDPKWYAGETLSLVIGQGYNLTTPAQIARMLTTIANGGRQPSLHLVRQIGVLEVNHSITQVSGRHWAELQQGMRRTVNWGTSRHVLGPDKFPVPTAGKTGTAQNEGGFGREHSWYMGYGPVNDAGQFVGGRPPLVVVAFFENGTEGSGVALPATRKVMAAYWGVEPPQSP
ncbi:MAG: penicillin-binding transpeptidase domain-containing protein [Meiothermus sp.]|nr:penicillin-binding transpeptidase domain-containing protein [Meiothermus sp.]